MIAKFRASIAKDIIELRAELRTTVAELRASVSEDIANLRGSVSETNVRVSKLETRIAETKSDLVKWMLAALTAQTALLLALKLV